MALLALTATTAITSPAFAQSLQGKTVQLTYLFPSAGATYEGPVDNTVGTTGTTTFFSQVNATPGDKTLQITFNVSSSFTGASFNGVRLTDFNNTVASFISPSILSTNNFAFDASRLTFDANNVFLNFSGLSFNPTSSLVVSLAPAVPEPATWGMMILGFGVVGAASRYRRCATKVSFAA